MKFIHTADIHLDSPLRNLDRYEGAPVDRIRGASRQAFDNLIELALTEGVDFVLIAGDLFDGDWKDFNTGLYFTKGAARLAEAGIKIFLIRGNHDAASKITKGLPWPKNVRELSLREPETIIDESLGIAVHGQSFTSPRIVEDLAARYPAAISGFFNIGMLHTSLNGREGHDSYAPTTLEVLSARGYDYWALGHIHKREIVSRDPFVVFPGNIQGRHIREAGAKSCELVTVEAGRVTGIEQRFLDVLRWSSVEIDLNGVEANDAAEAVIAAALRSVVKEADGTFVAARVFLKGRTKLHARYSAKPEMVRAMVQALSIEQGGGNLWIEKVRIETLPQIDVAAMRLRQDSIGEVARLLVSLKNSSEQDRTWLGEEIRELTAKFPAEYQGTRWIEQEELGQLLDSVEADLLGLLSTGEA